MISSTLKDEAGMLAFLQAYVQIKTVHPTADYTGVLKLFKIQAGLDELEYQEVLLPSGYPVGIISYYGTDTLLPSLALNHHMDVVPVPNPHEWCAPPFEGTLANEKIIGRGTQDMKGIGVVHYWALRQLKQEKKTLQRTIHLLLMPDEEQGGFNGMNQFVITPEFRKLNIGFALDEGIASGDDTFLYIKIAERKPLQIRMISKGQLAHGSSLLSHNPIHELIDFLLLIKKDHEKEQTTSQGINLGSYTSFNITSLE